MANIMAVNNLRIKKIHAVGLYVLKTLMAEIMFSVKTCHAYMRH